MTCSYAQTVHFELPLQGAHCSERIYSRPDCANHSDTVSACLRAAGYARRVDPADRDDGQSELPAQLAQQFPALWPGRAVRLGCVDRTREQEICAVSGHDVRLLPAVHGTADPVLHAEQRTRPGYGKTSHRQLDAGGSCSQRNIHAIVDQNTGIGRLAQASGQLEHCAAREFASPDVNRYRCALLRDDRLRLSGKFRPGKNVVIGDEVESGQHQAKQSPAATPRPRTQAEAVMRRLPGGVTSRTQTVPLPQATSTPRAASFGSTSSTVPGAACCKSGLSTRGRNSLTVRAPSWDQAPGISSSPRMWRSTSTAFFDQSIRASCFSM